jgi:GT2 family glycosyltransferase
MTTNSILVSTLNHNLPGMTDNLVNQVKQSIFTNYELFVVDNGSEQENISQHTTRRLEANTYFGGGCNVILDYLLNKTAHEYLLILNNDLLFHGYYFLEKLLAHAEQGNFAMLSPSVINASFVQDPWRQMRWWGADRVREVKWIDFQCPLLRRDLCEIIRQFPQDLYLGWGVDFYAGLVSGEHNLRSGVCDDITITHLNSQTLAQNKVKNMTMKDFNKSAHSRMTGYFAGSRFNNKYLEFRKYAESYHYPSA